MNKRQKEVQQAFLDNEKAVLKKLEGNYQDALDEINSKIELLMARQDADMQHVIYQVEYQKALKTQVQSILETLQTNEFETVSEYLSNAYHDGFIGTMYDLQGQGIPLIFPIDQEAVVAAVQQETKLSEPLYTAMGKDITVLKKKITGEISRGLSSGQMYGEISRNIAAWARIPKNNAARIARTEAHRIQCKATADAQFRAKEKGADVVKQWDASLDKRTRDSHVQVDGEIRELDERFSNGLLYPGDPNGGAGEVINCRCALLQRARWALGNDYTKWSPDAEIEYSDDGTAQLAIIDAKNFKEFKGYYMDATRQMTMNFENGASSRVRSSTQKMKSQETIEKTGKSGTIELEDILIRKSVGAKFRNYDVLDPATGEIFHFVEDTKIQNAQVFAGSGTKKSLHEGVAEGLAEQIGGSPEKWQHCKGDGVLNYHGEERRAEVHWFQEETIGKVKFKVKEWKDEG